MNVTLATHLPKEDETVVSDLYQQLLQAWNNKSANDFSALFTVNGTTIGFDGSQMNGTEEISESLTKIFQDHQTGKYVWRIREVRFLSPETALLRAVAGMVLHDQNDLTPDLNAIQTLIAVKQNANWLITLFQNTPAKFDGQPVVSMELTNELQHALQLSKDTLLV